MFRSARSRTRLDRLFLVMVVSLSRFIHLASVPLVACRIYLDSSRRSLLLSSLFFKSELGFLVWSALVNSIPFKPSQDQSAQHQGEVVHMADETTQLED